MIKNKIANFVAYILITIGIILLFGTAGMSDTDSISISQILTQISVSGIFIMLGYFMKH